MPPDRGTTLALTAILTAFACATEHTSLNPTTTASNTTLADADSSTSPAPSNDSSTTGTDSTTLAETIDTTSTSGDSMSGSDTSTSLLDTSSSTTVPAPFCGDGNLDADEECDDMNDDPDDGCKLCTHDRFIFVSSAIWQGFKLQGLFGADQRCRMLAGQALLPNAFSYRAWLSDSQTAATDRILHSKGRYTLVNGIVIAADWDALTSGSLENPISVTEKSETAQGGPGIWTGTLPSGQQAFGSTFCNDWGGDDDTVLGGSGIRTQTDALWSFFEHNDCGSESALYCVEN